MPSWSHILQKYLVYERLCAGVNPDLLSLCGLIWHVSNEPLFYAHLIHSKSLWCLGCFYRLWICRLCAHARVCGNQSAPRKCVFVYDALSPNSLCLQAPWYETMIQALLVERYIFLICYFFLILFADFICIYKLPGTIIWNNDSGTCREVHILDLLFLSRPLCRFHMYQKAIKYIKYVLALSVW